MYISNSPTVYWIRNVYVFFFHKYRNEQKTVFTVKLFFIETVGKFQGVVNNNIIYHCCHRKWTFSFQSWSIILQWLTVMFYWLTVLFFIEIELFLGCEVSLLQILFSDSVFIITLDSGSFINKLHSIIIKTLCDCVNDINSFLYQCHFWINRLKLKLNSVLIFYIIWR